MTAVNINIQSTTVNTDMLLKNFYTEITKTAEKQLKTHINKQLHTPRRIEERDLASPVSMETENRIQEPAFSNSQNTNLPQRRGIDAYINNANIISGSKTRRAKQQF